MWSCALHPLTLPACGLTPWAPPAGRRDRGAPPNGHPGAHPPAVAVVSVLPSHPSAGGLGGASAECQAAERAGLGAGPGAHVWWGRPAWAPAPARTGSASYVTRTARPETLCGGFPACKYSIPARASTSGLPAPPPALRVGEKREGAADCPALCDRRGSTLEYKRNTRIFTLQSNLD